MANLVVAAHGMTPSYAPSLNRRVYNRVIPGREQLVSPLFNHTPVFSAKGWLSLNYWRGCNLECGYCYRPGRRAEDLAAHTPVKLFEEEFVADNLFDHPYFVPGFAGQPTDFLPTVIGLHTSSTEAFLPGVKESTFKLLRLLDKQNITNSVVIITKLFLTGNEIQDLNASLNHLSVFVSICYSGLNRQIEPVNSAETVAKKLKFMQQLADLGPGARLRPIHYFRPIALGWNDTPDVIARTLQFSRCAPAITAGGITMWDEEIAALRERHIPLPGEPKMGWHEYGYRRKYFPKEVEERVIAIKESLSITTPLFRRASCSLSFLRGVADYNAYRTEGEKNCTRDCPVKQQARCAAIVMPEEERVAAAFERLGLSHAKWELQPNRVLVQPEDHKFGILDAFGVRHVLGFPVILAGSQNA